MTFIQYYIAQFKDFPFCWRLAVRTHHKAYALTTLLLLLNPPAIYIMYLYDTGIMPVDTRFQKKRRSDGDEARR